MVGNHFRFWRASGVKHESRTVMGKSVSLACLVGGTGNFPPSSGWLRLRGIGDFGFGLKRDWFGRGCDTPYIEEDGDQHVAQDVDAGAGSGDDPIYGHDEWNGRTDDVRRQACSGENERQYDHPGF